MAEDQSPRQARQRLSAAQELAEVKSELMLFTAGAAHDLQQPLRQIIALALRVLGRVKARPAAVADARRILELAHHMRGLIEYLVAYQQAGASDMDVREVAVREALDDVLVPLAARIAAERARVTIGPLPNVRADAIMLKQVLHHLIDNALKFRRQGRAAAVRVAGRRRQRWVEIFVEDEGIGIEARYLEQIFEPFKRLNCPEAFSGSGLGLPICRKIARRHGGALLVSSRPGRGSRFTLRLPAA